MEYEVGWTCSMLEAYKRVQYIRKKFLSYPINLDMYRWISILKVVLNK
jgi:hypothetical protein